MKTQSFDERNAQDFERITKQLTEALSFILNNKDTKATVAELSRISGVHRNTIYNRKWPLDRLAKIKDIRALSEIELARNKLKRQDPVSCLEDRLEKSRLEVVYWFNKCRDAEEVAAAFEVRLTRMQDARDVSLKKNEERLAKIRSLEAENKRLRDTISILTEENRESSE